MGFSGGRIVVVVMVVMSMMSMMVMMVMMVVVVMMMRVDGLAGALYPSDLIELPSHVGSLQVAIPMTDRPKRPIPLEIHLPLIFR